MTWFGLSIVAAVCWGVVNIVDKFIVGTKAISPRIPVIIACSIGFAFSIVHIVVRGGVSLNAFELALSFLAGGLYVVTLFVYLLAVNKEEISKIVPFFYVTPFFTMLLSWIFIGEVLPQDKVIGVVLLVVGASLLAMTRTVTVGLSTPVMLMIIAAFTYAAHTVILGAIGKSANYWEIFSAWRMGAFIACFPLLYLSGRETMSFIRSENRLALLVGLNEVLNLGATLAITIAVAFGSATLVNAISATSPFFVLIFATLISMYRPQWLKENLSRSKFVQKLAAIVLMFLGIAAIS